MEADKKKSSEIEKDDAVDAYYTAIRHPPPAGSTCYPLSENITSTHPLYTHPPFSNTGARPDTLNYNQLQGIANRNNLHYAQFPQLHQEEGHWTTVGQYLNGPVTYIQDLLSIQASIEKAQAGGPAKKPAKAPAKKKMPSASTKRVKGYRIERPFVIGSEAWPLDETGTRKPDTDPSHSKGWRVYVRGIEGQPPITTWLKKVQFKIFHTYTTPTRIIEEPPFQVEETGWGGFNVEIKLFFIPEVNARQQDRQHYLQLEPYGTEAEIQKQIEAKLVRAEYLEIIEFNEPTEALWDILTDEAQFQKPAKRPTGKGKAKAVLKKEEGEGSVELPEHSSANSPYSKDLERANLLQIRRAIAKADALMAIEDKRLEETKAKLAAIRALPESS